MVLSMDRWRGKIAVVTGASSGIGAGIARRLVEEGLLVVGIARRSDLIDKMASELSDKKGKLYSYKADISKGEEIKLAFQWIIENLGPVQVLVNNAGIHYRQTLLDGDPENWKKTLDVNVLALCIATQEATKMMRKIDAEGHVFHINSIGGHSVANLPNMDIYSATKFAVTALTETLRRELQQIKSKIRITSISPGAVDTPIFDEKTRNSQAFNDLIGKHMLQPEDIADAIVYVLSTPPHVQVHELTIKPLNEVL
nr:farnesol dehydrogenase-like [Leptinotarsa decemlineata]XP_023013174.1 farnesol dehydrogenase-like [Leptinotarsa decemlineata]